MGKGFAAASGVLGEDLGDLIQEACERRVRGSSPDHLDALFTDLTNAEP